MDWLESAVKVVGLLASLGVLGGLVFAARSWWNWRRWSVFVSLIERWAQDRYQRFRLDAGVAPQDSVLRPLVANWLYEAQFSPKEATGLLDYAVLFARARVLKVMESDEGKS